MSVAPRSILLAMLTTFLQAAPAPAQDAAESVPSMKLPAELERVLRDYEGAWRDGDAAALAALFTEDGFVPTPRGWARGRAAILAQYGRAGGPLRLRAHAYGVEGSVGWIVGAYGYGDGDPVPDGGKFLLALRRGDDGRWLIAADLDSGNHERGG